MANTKGLDYMNEDYGTTADPLLRVTYWSKTSRWKRLINKLASWIAWPQR